MAIRMTGLASGMDTERIIKELMQAQSAKKTKIEASKTKLEWTKEAWSSLNTKLYSFYTDYASKMKLQSTYKTKKAASSDETKATITANSNSVNGTYQLEIDQLATSQYVTSGKVNTTNLGTNALTKTTKLSDIDSSLVGKELQIVSGGTTSYFQVRSDSTINDFTSALNSAGLNATFDETQQRFFISSKKSGADNTYSITTANLSAEELSARQAVESAVSYANLSSASKGIIDASLKKIASAAETMRTETDLTSDTYKDALKQYNEAVTSINQVAYEYQKSEIEKNSTQALKAQLYYENYDAAHTEAKKPYYEEDGSIKSTYKDKYQKEWNIMTAEDREKTTYNSAEEYIEGSVNKLVNKATDAQLASKINTMLSKDAEVKARLTSIQETGISDISSYSPADIEKFGLTTFKGFDEVTPESVAADCSTSIGAYGQVTTRTTELTNAGSLAMLGLTDITVASDGTMTVGGGANDSTNLNIPDGMAIIEGKDSIVRLNGAELTSSSTTLDVNGLSISLKGETKGSKISLTVDNDVEAVYKTVQDFVTQYNSIVKEMSTLINAESSKGYDVLTDDQKEAMSDDEIEKWEKKIKDALFRNDSTLSGIVSSMRSAVMSNATVDGKKYSLSSLGIMTSTDYTEGGLLHIYGDSTDSVYADKQDKLKAMLTQDPEKVMNIMTQISENLRSAMSDKMKATSLSSSLTFYNDKQIKSQLEDYEDEIDEWEDRLTDIEDRYYTQFSQMESAMSSLKSMQNSLSSLFSS